jgi:group I intron endonuclease
MGFIYRFTSPTNKSYVGQTIRPIKERFKEHLIPSSKCKAIYGAIKKHGWDKMKKEWIEVPDDELNFYEEMLVALLGTIAPGGYNLREGGGSGGKLCEEVKQKISKSMTGKTLTDEHKQNISDTHKGKTLTDDHKQKLSVSHKGKTHSDGVKQQISESLTGRTLSDDHKQNISNSMFGKTGEDHPRSKKVYQYDLDGTFVQSFASGREAASHLNKTDGTHISACARDKCPSAYGFKWSYTKL